MKLIHKTILYYLLISLPLLVIAGIISYGEIKNRVKESNDEVMWEEKREAEKLIQSLSTPQNILSVFKGQPSIQIDSSGRTGYEFDNIVKMDTDAEQVNYRQLKSFYKSKNTNYLITILRPTLEEDDLVESLLMIFLILIGSLVLAFFLVNWWLSKTIWKPFYKTIEVLDNYNLKNYLKGSLQKSNTKEFSHLNDSLNKMMDKMYSDFIHQKEFTENASHEMQTPVAIIKAKVELLMQSPNLKEEEMNQLQGIESSINKLASLNKALLLLAKIENNQFKENSEVNLKKVIEKVIENYSDLFKAKHITVETNRTDDCRLRINSGLCDVLIANLIQNAIRHNQINGKVNIELNANELIISNTGEALSIHPDELFVRFKKNDASRDSLGLGLSIVKGIADVYGFKVNYSYKNDLHRFALELHSNIVV